ncbi:PH domain-containing protein [Fastidiosipila sanguinis]|uniref:YdbS-like PH domain-containing protein n=1 Tax=Fastidiosipila sanguinis TaxID=236753 RepID=A0A2S0KPY4_9FIRM|nr:PH domain-containing protein [Fastidiosipila sanguinis]AVM43077.1 hypothetical protein C5Q98_07575 [Fastidiosipila sanguinis]
MKPYFIDDNEKILWEGRPSKLMYFFSGFNLFAVIFLIIWSSIVLGISSQTFTISKEFWKIAENNPFHNTFGMFTLIPFIMIFVVFIIFVFIPIKKIIESFRVRYYVTDLRIYIESGIIGKDIQNIEYREIDKLNVNVGLLGKMMNRGTISLTPDRNYSDGDGSYVRSGFKLIGVEKPYELFNIIKKNALDVTTDQQYPNAYRPDRNSGYNTRLDDER